MLAGEIIATKDHNKVEIELDHRKPSKVLVRFEERVPSCNPHHHHHDRVWFQIEKPHHPHGTHNTSYNLIIHWHVNEVRTIQWVVYF